MAGSGSGTKARGEYLLHEGRMRKMLSNMYVAFSGSADNSRTMLEMMPGEVGKNNCAGHDVVRSSMKDMCEWLHDMSMLSKDPKIFGAAFLDPIRAAAQMRLELHRITPSSTTVEALVFAKMPYFDNTFKSGRCILSVVAPCLRAPMTIRVSKDEESIRYGYYTFENCQPIPLVNRIHQTTGNLSPSARIVRLTEFDYLYTALDDIRHLERSLEMECFCEAPTLEAQKKRRLAAPFVTFGTVHSVRGQSISIQSLDETKTVRMAATEQFLELSGATPCDFEGKVVRLLGTQRYEPDRDQGSDPEYPAVYAMEEGDKTDLLVQEECGRVRLRGRVNVDSIPAAVRKDLLSLRCISHAGPTASYDYRAPEDGIMARFVDAHSRIRDMRYGAKINAVQVTEERVIDRRKSGINGLIALTTSKTHSALSRIFLNIIMQNDVNGEYSADAAVASLRMHAGYYRRQMSFLRHLGVIESGNGNAKNVTKKGRQVAEGIALKAAGRIPRPDIPQIMHPDALVKRGIPPSLTLGMLKSQSLGDYTRATVDGRATEVCWKRGCEGDAVAEEDGGAASQYERLRAGTLAVMGSVSYPLAALKIAELARAGGEEPSAFAVGLLLSDLSNDGQGTVRLDDDVWVYTVEARVRDLFDKARDCTLSVDEVVAQIKVGAVRKDEVSKALEALADNGTLRPMGGGFTHNSGIEPKKEALARAGTKKMIAGMFSNRNAVDDEDIIAFVTGKLAAAGDTRNSLDKAVYVREILNEMEGEGVIWLNGRTVVKGDA